MGLPSFFFATFWDFPKFLNQNVRYGYRNITTVEIHLGFMSMGDSWDVDTEWGSIYASELVHHILGSVYKIISAVTVYHIRSFSRSFIRNRLGIGILFKIVIRSEPEYILPQTSATAELLQQSREGNRAKASSGGGRGARGDRPCLKTAARAGLTPVWPARHPCPTRSCPQTLAARPHAYWPLDPHTSQSAAVAPAPCEVFRSCVQSVCSGSMSRRRPLFSPCLWSSWLGLSSAITTEGCSDPFHPSSTAFRHFHSFWRQRQSPD